MSRSGYEDSADCSNWSMLRWRGAVASAIRGKRGQAFLREMLTALDAMPEKQLIAAELEKSGQVCAIGCVGKARGIDMSELDPNDRETVAEVFGISAALAAEIMWTNDEATWHNHEAPESRFERVRAWVVAQLREGE